MLTELSIIHAHLSWAWNSFYNIEARFVSDFLSAETLTLLNLLSTFLKTCSGLTQVTYEKKKIPARSHTFVEIDHEIISTVIFLPSADSFKKGCCQLQAKVCALITG